MEIRTYPWKPENEILVTIHEKTAIICEHDKLPTTITVKIEYVPKNKIAELDSVRRWISEKAVQKNYLLEEFVLALYNDFNKAIEPKYLYIKVCGEGVGHGLTCIEKKKVSFAEVVN